MKLKAILPALVFAVVSSFSMTAFSADAEKAPAAEGEKASAKKMKPHSHMEEKTGVPHSDAKAEKKAAKPKAKKDQHLHTRDGK